ncbi:MULTISPECIES: hypothetical protein [unclassified Imperialibacter]|uniref:hypothetical protein n=1 Tax=unclassified Imperialibacter TaxID=2629706 RepID=UPI00125EB0A4|nr:MULTISPECIES: hypothetical protein [unclassified Imperialibacter]
MATSANEKIEMACVEAREKLAQLGIEEKIQAELDWVLGSFRNDQNSSGLYEIGAKALKALVKYKKDKPKAITKKMIDELEKALKAK